MPRLLMLLVAVAWSAGCGLIIDLGDETHLRTNPEEDTGVDSSADVVDATDTAVLDTAVIDTAIPDVGPEAKPLDLANLVFYRASDGLLAVGRVESDGAILTFGTTNIPGGWSNLVAISNRHLVGYSRSTGTRQLVTLDGTSTAPTVTLSPSESVGGNWTALVRFGTDSLVSYAMSDGSMRLDSMTPSGLALSRSFTPPSDSTGADWKDFNILAATRNQDLFLYASASRGMYFRWSSDVPQRLTYTKEFTSDWGFVVPVADDRYFFYKTKFPELGGAVLTSAGAANLDTLHVWPAISEPFPLSLRFTSITSMRTSLLFRFSNLTYTGSFTKEGTFELLGSSTLDPAWTHVVSLE